jgi:hypothetical protein
MPWSKQVKMVFDGRGYLLLLALGNISNSEGIDCLRLCQRPF